MEIDDDLIRISGFSNDNGGEFLFAKLNFINWVSFRNLDDIILQHPKIQKCLDLLK